LHPKASISLMSQMEAPQSRGAAAVRHVLSTGGPRATGVSPELVRLIVETNLKSNAVERLFQDLEPRESVERLTGGFYSVQVNPARARQLLDSKDVDRVQTKKPKKLHLEAALPEAQVSTTAQTRQVAETGKGVLIGIVDSGFDLSHPMFRDGAGKLRVNELLDQNTNQTFTTPQLEQGWSNGSNPGADENGHGTHVASIAGGSHFGTREGVAPDARYLLVKTNFNDTDKAVSWIFNQAGATPCVINMSLGHHFGSHDGTDAEERLHESLTGPGKIIVISAGNEANDPIHLGSRFSQDQSRSVIFDVLQPDDGGRPRAPLTMWYDAQDQFDISLVTPTGSVLPVPAPGSPGQTLSGSQIQITLARGPYQFNNLIQAQIIITFQEALPGAQKLRGWGLRLRCRQAVLGRLDVWFANSGMAEFRPNEMVETARTVGLAATGKACVSVASYVSKTSFDGDDGHEADQSAVVGRISSFSSLGPTRDGREKPDIAAPGQYVTAALATGSSESRDGRFADTANRLLSIAGTSMASPMVTGVVALLLQKKGTLTPAQVKQALFASARKDGHTGALPWTPQYGHGKIDAAKALDEI